MRNLGLRRLAVCIGIASLACAAAAAPAPVPEPTPATVSEASGVREIQTVTSRSDTTDTLFERLGIQDPEALLFVRRDPQCAALRFLGNGRQVRARVNSAGRLLKLQLVLENYWEAEAAGAIILTVERSGAVLVSGEAILMVDPEHRPIETADITVGTTIAEAIRNANLPLAVQMQLPFALEGYIGKFRKGDRLRLLYERLFVDGIDIGSGRILAYRVARGKEVKDLFLYQSKDAKSAYYTADGQTLSLKLESPMKEGTYVLTSPFMPLRRNPVTRRLRPHQGTDFSAKRGTPIYAAGGGTIIRRERFSGYGLCIDIQHGEDTITRYAHMSRFESGLKKGSIVRQGQRIGFVGRTGLASGNHLHYEVRIHGVPVDPMRITSRKSASLFVLEVEDFRNTVEDLSELLGPAQE